MRNLYKRKIPKRNFHETAVDVLRMNNEQFDQFKSVAEHYRGGAIIHDRFPKVPDRKLLPSTLDTIQDLSSPSELATMMHMERLAHEDHSKEFHKGGGLLDATQSIFSVLWQNLGLGPTFNKWFGHFDYDSPENKVDDPRYAQIIQQSYKKKDERDDSVGDWVRDKALGTDEFSVWVDKDDQEAHVALRGTKANTKDLLADMKIIATNKSGNADHTSLFLEAVERKYPNYKLDVSGHSLGGDTLLNVFNDKDHNLHYERVNLFNPGTSPIADLDGAKEAIDDDKFHFYLNSGDMLSNTFASVLPSGRKNVYWAKPKAFSPIANHGIQQWV